MVLDGKGERADKVVARQIRALRVKSGLSQGELGNRMGITFQQVQKYEKGANALSPGRIRQVCDIFGVTPNELFRFGDSDEGLGLPPPSVAALRMLQYFEQLDGTLQSAVVRLIAVFLGGHDVVE